MNDYQNVHGIFFFSEILDYKHVSFNQLLQLLKFVRYAQKVALTCSNNPKLAVLHHAFIVYPQFHICNYVSVTMLK